MQYGAGVYYAQQAADQAVSQIITGAIEIPSSEEHAKRARDEAASIVREQNSKHAKAEMIKNAQQLRLRQPNMVKKEY